MPPVEESLTRPRASSGKPVEVAVGIEPGAEEKTGNSFADHVSRTILSRSLAVVAVEREGNFEVITVMVNFEVKK